MTITVGHHEYIKRLEARVAELEAAKIIFDPEDLPLEVLDAVSEALGDCYDCGRTWSAWGVGTMTQNDFYLVAESAERVDEIARAAIMALVGDKK